MRRQRMGMAVVVAVMLGGTMAARGAGPSPIASYLDGQTVAVVRLDVTKVDTAAIQQAVEKLFAEQHVPLTEEVKQGMSMGAMVANGMLGRFKALGGGQVYALVAMPDVWPAMEPLAVLIRVGAGGDVAGMEAWVKALPLAGAGPNGEALVVKTLGGNTVFVGTAVALKRLETLRAQARPDVEARLAESTSALTIVVTPTADMGRVVAEMMPRLPAELGGASTQGLAGHLSDVTLEASLPPGQELTLTAHTGESRDTAMLLSEMARRGLDVVRREMREFGPGGREAAKGPQVMALLDALQPRVTSVAFGGTTLSSATVHLSGDQLQALGGLLAPAFDEAREQAGRTTSMMNLRQIGMACMMYMNDKKQAWPGSFDDLKPYLKDSTVLINPRDPQHRRYVLEHWTSDDLKRFSDRYATVPIAYEAGDTAQVAVAFLDGHVEIETRVVLTEQLAAARETAKK